MLDAHCHLDLYPDPSRVTLEAERGGVFTVLVTNFPSSFDAAFPNILQYKRVRLALGLHPLCPESHSPLERSLFKERVARTSFIGEIGLDFSRYGITTKNEQLISFTHALRCLDRTPKFVTVHSRQAEEAVLDIVSREYGGPIVLHWYTGTHRSLDAAVKGGHFFSVNPAMFQSKKGLSTVEKMPPERVLTETDGPFVTVGSRPAVPNDVRIVENKLAEMWNAPPLEIRQRITDNFNRILEPIKSNRKWSSG